MESKDLVFLNEDGLRLYDELIKAYIDDRNNAGGDALRAESDRAKAAEKELLDELANFSNSTNTSLSALSNQIAVLSGEGEGSIKKAVNDAVESIVDGAPEALDTLRELAEWINGDENATSSLLKVVDDKADTAYVDAEIERIFNSIDSIEDSYIQLLFKTPVKFEGGNLSNVITDLGDDEMLVLSGNENITENIYIGKDAVIDANGATFSGNIIMDPDKEIVIKNAVFLNPVNL